MNLSGAMDEDRELFESGLVAIHPKDDFGRVVLFVDRIRAILPLATRDATVSSLHIGTLGCEKTLFGRSYDSSHS